MGARRNTASANANSIAAITESRPRRGILAARSLSFWAIRTSLAKGQNRTALLRLAQHRSTSHEAATGDSLQLKASLLQARMTIRISRADVRFLPARNRGAPTNGDYALRHCPRLPFIVNSLAICFGKFLSVRRSCGVAKTTSIALL